MTIQLLALGMISVGPGNSPFATQTVTERNDSQSLLRQPRHPTALSHPGRHLATENTYPVLSRKVHWPHAKGSQPNIEWNGLLFHQLTPSDRV